MNRAHRVAAELEAGSVWINTYNMGSPEVSFGGCKMSGFGREQSEAAMLHYTQLKSIYVETNDIDSPI